MLSHKELSLPKGLGAVVTEGLGREQEAEVRSQEQASVFWARQNCHSHELTTAVASLHKIPPANVTTWRLAGSHKPHSLLKSCYGQFMASGVEGRHFL